MQVKRQRPLPMPKGQTPPRTQQLADTLLRVTGLLQPVPE